ncbi:Na(+)-translocating NADH-quinone reductase subunit F [Sporomusa ovata DSM 2662]|uniref:Methyltransferase corrinoid activation protein n=1 Tax=Sporomusa ovata TaxID=2378 RepID=A0A0U1L0C1_9FIRM|nr:ASKHA domain-containing protein [Sporomusa ovata]EQB27845.1 ferredoxin [Sporomusa ovata DSM 2662]CQR72779.1 Methyltransferase corrinoid activation protein [Sporomusa ovata]
MKSTVVFQPAGCRGMISCGNSVLTAARELGVAMEAPCGGGAVCGKCKVIINEMSNVSPVTEKEKKTLSAEELTNNYRLACSTQIYGDVLVIVPPESSLLNQVVLETGTVRPFSINPAVKKYYVELHKPTLADCRDDFSRLKAAMESRFIQLDKQITIDYQVLGSLPDVLRQSDWKVTVTLWQDSEIVAVEPGKVAKSYGIAVDVGTTTIAAYLCELTTGMTIAQASCMNSQVGYGDDVLSRISYCVTNEDGLAKLQQLIIADINTLVSNLSDKATINPEDILEIVLVFNTVMHHIALHINPQYIGSAPFAAVIKEAVNVKARELGIKIAASGYIHCLPLEAGFVGADNVAVLIAEQPHRQSKMSLIVDIGTNGEINFGNSEGVLSASCATGPALEGAQIKFGMRAAPGAIANISIDRKTKEPEIEVIESLVDNKTCLPRARGICGSGIIDAVAELFKAGIIRKDGSFNKDIQCSRLRKGATGKFEYVLAWAAETAIDQDITITQKDIRAVQLAKAALYAGAKILMQKKGVAEVECIALAGAFGSYINKVNALVIGMIPDCDPASVVAVGNAAGEGAKLALCDNEKRSEAQEVARFVQFVETAAEPNFQEEFLQAMYFPHGRDQFLHIAGIIDKIPRS